MVLEECQLLPKQKEPFDNMLWNKFLVILTKLVQEIIKQNNLEKETNKQEI